MSLLGHNVGLGGIQGPNLREIGKNAKKEKWETNWTMLVNEMTKKSRQKFWETNWKIFLKEKM